MPWTVKNPPPPARNWTEAEKRRCVKAANAVLKQTGDEGQAVRACIAAAGKSSRQKQSSLSLTQSTRPLALKPLPFMAAIESARMRGVVLPEVYYGELIGLARALAFTVSRLATVDQIDRVLKKLVAVLEDGGTLADFKRLAERDPDVAALPEGRVETIFRNGAQTAYNRGRAEFHTRHKATRPYGLYSAINDSRVRPNHLAMDGTILPIDHPWWGTRYPPNGHSCFVPGTRISGQIQAGLKTFYSGPVIEMITRTGKRLTVTANHPVLTTRGWIAADLLQEGDALFSYAGQDKFEISRGIQDQQGPSRVEDVFDSLRNYGTAFLDKVAPLDLYGDGRFTDGKVHVIRPDWKLRQGLYSNLQQGFRDQRFIFSHAPAQLKSAIGKLAEIFETFLSSPCRFGVNPTASLESFRIGFNLIPDQFISFFRGANWNSRSFKEIGNRRNADSQRFSDFFNTLASLISSDNIFGITGLPDSLGTDQGLRFFPGALWDIVAFEKFSDDRPGHAEFLAKLCNARPGEVITDDLIGIRKFDFRGHVYDFQTTTGWMFSDSIISSNCRCSVISLTREEAERRGVTVEPTDEPSDPGWDYSVMDGSDLAIRDAAARKRQSVDPALAGLVPEGVEPPKTLEEMIALGRTDLEELESYLPEHIREGKGVYYERVREYKKALAKLYKARGITTDKAAVVQNEGLGAVQVKRASQEFPDAWTEKADAFGPLYAEHTEGRAWQITLGPNFNTGLLDLDVFGRVEAKGRDGYIVSSNHIDAVHEYTHRLQAAMPELDDYFQKLHVKRTAGTELELLREVTGNPNYRPNEKTRKDDYLEPYMGKEYEHNAHQYTGRAGALEMMTVAYQMLLGGDGREFRRLYSEDRELLELSLALLLRYKP